MIDVQAEAVINRPRDVVFSFATDPANAPRWCSGIKSVRWETRPPLRRGSRMTFEARFMSRPFEYTSEVAELVPGERLVMRAAPGPYAMETTYTCSDAGPGRTRLSLRNHGEPGEWASTAARVIAGAMKKANLKDLAALKLLLEKPQSSW